MKTFWKIFSSFLALLISILLVISLIVLPAISFFTDTVDPSKLVEIIISSGLLTDPKVPAAGSHQILLSAGTAEGLPEGMGFEALTDALQELANSGILDVEQLMEDLEIPADTEIDHKQMIQELTESKAVQVLLSTYTEDILNAAAGTGAAPALTADTVMDILAPHMDQIVTIVENNLPADVKIDRQKLTDAIDKAVNSALPEIVDALPPAQEIANAVVGTNDDMPTVMCALNFVRSGQLRLLAFALVAVLLILVFLLRLPGFSGLRWVSISGLVGAVFVGGLGYLLQARPVLTSLQSAIGDIASLVMPLLSGLSSTFVTFAVFYGVAGMVLIVGYGVLSAFVIKKDK